MNWLKSLWADESGSVLTAEAALLGTMGVIGAGVGLNMASTSLDEEFKDVSRSLRHLDQSYEIRGFAGCRSQTAGSAYRQEDVKKSIDRLEEQEDDLEQRYKKEAAKDKERLEELREDLRRKSDEARKRLEDEEKKKRQSSSSKRKSSDDDDD
jgi:Skp family chaperone for outer membrane proteins